MKNKINKMCRSELEAAYREVLANLVASREFAAQLMKENKELLVEVANGKTKDAMIEALQRRIHNVNNEYHSRYFERQTVSLDDVRKLMGEEDS